MKNEKEKKSNSTMREMYQELNKAYEMMSIHAPDYFRDFIGFFDSTERNGVLSEKIKELISIALAMNAHCLPCIALHVNNAIESGATKQEILEASEVAVLMGGSPSFVYIKNVLEACDEFGAE
jgi:AhpD family alkylhydroperoxidase